MARWRGWLVRIRETFSRDCFESEIDEEIRFHLDRETERLLDTGLDPESARREAERVFGRVPELKELARLEAGFPWLDVTLRDLRFALRQLRKAKGFTSAVVLTLGLGIGATTAIYSVVDSVLLRPLPYAEADRLVQIVQQNQPDQRWHLSVADYLAIEEQQTSMENFAALQLRSASLTGSGSPEQIRIGRVTADWFRTLRVDPVEGRGFGSDDDGPDGPAVVVLSNTLARRLHGSAAAATGSSLTLDGTPHLVVGVLGPERGTLAGVTADAWPLLRLEPPTRRGPFFLRGLGRLSAGVTLAEARDDLDAISQRIYPLWADGFRDERARLTPHGLQAMIVGDIGTRLWPMLGAVFGVMLIAIANVANLLLVRASSREREMALRTALGATRRRLVRQLLTESSVLAVTGGIVGFTLAGIGLWTLVAMGARIPRIEEVALNGTILATATALTLGAAILFGMAPLVQVLRQWNRGTGNLGSRSSTPGPRWHRVRAALVTAEFAIAFPLLMGAGVLLGSLVKLSAVNPGYDPAGLVSLRISLPALRYPGYEEVRTFWDDATRELAALPEVAVAGMSTSLPPSFAGDSNNFDLLSNPVPMGESEHVALWAWASPGFLEALSIPLVAGRMLGPDDLRDGPPVVVVSESWAERYAPKGDAVGTRFYAGGDRSVAMTVVGVVGDVKYGGLESEDEAMVYEPYTQFTPRSGHVLLRVRGTEAAALARAREVITRLDPDLAISEVETMNDRMSHALSQPKHWTTLLGLFAGLGLVLAAVGIYGVLSYHVSRQVRELGIRMALGATPRSLHRLVLGRGLALAALGMTVGIAAGLYLARWLESLVFELPPNDPRVVVGVAILLGVVALLASHGPARRATRIDPATVLKTD